MGGLALLAKECGHEVSGSDKDIYPPMKDQLSNAKIPVEIGFSIEPAKAADLTLIGNAISRGNLVVEYLLEHQLPFLSGPEWLYTTYLKNRWVLAVAGTHGKTTTTSMLAWILETNGFNPGFCVGGIPNNFGVSARYGSSPYFVIEADEYDTAFFDKRSKFIHYRPKTVILNNLEYDHADIFPDMAAIARQVRFFLRTVPQTGRIVYANEKALTVLLKEEKWSEHVSVGGMSGEWQVKLLDPAGQAFNVLRQGQVQGAIEWELFGEHNAQNALSALVAAEHIGISPKASCKALHTFKGVKKRLELKAERNGITLYDDFAHHPTAIKATIKALRAKIGQNKRILVILELGTNTMRSGEYTPVLADALTGANAIYFYFDRPLLWKVEEVTKKCRVLAHGYQEPPPLLDALFKTLKPQDHILVMSNGTCGGIVEKIARLI